MVRGIEAIICSQPWPCSEALSVAYCESRYVATAVSADGANYGLFQINRIWASYFGERWAYVLDAANNVAMAFDIWQKQGWRPWACRAGG